MGVDDGGHVLVGTRQVVKDGCERPALERVIVGGQHEVPRVVRRVGPEVADRRVVRRVLGQSSLLSDIEARVRATWARVRAVAVADRVGGVDCDRAREGPKAHERDTARGHENAEQPGRDPASPGGQPARCARADAADAINHRLHVATAHPPPPIHVPDPFLVGDAHLRTGRLAQTRHAMQLARNRHATR